MPWQMLAHFQAGYNGFNGPALAAIVDGRFRFQVVRLHVAGTAQQVEQDHRLGPGRMVSLSSRQWMVFICAGMRSMSGFAGRQVRQRQPGARRALAARKPGFSMGKLLQQPKVVVVEEADVFHPMLE